MKALSLWNPWAAAILLGAKRTETRDYPPSKLGLKAGDEIALHVAKTKNRETLAAWERLRATLPGLQWDGHSRGGEVVAIFTLGIAWRVSADQSEGWAAFAQGSRPAGGIERELWDDLQCGGFAPGRWAWPLVAVVPLRRPVTVRGHQGAWTLEAEEERLVRAGVFAEPELTVTAIESDRDEVGEDPRDEEVFSRAFGATALGLPKPDGPGPLIDSARLIAGGALEPAPTIPMFQNFAAFASSGTSTSKTFGSHVTKDTDRGVVKAAQLSPCGTWRYTLERWWDREKEPLVACLVNPSTADAERDDATVTKLMGYARAWGHGGLVLVNPFAYRSTDPEQLREQGRERAIGPGNDDVLAEVCGRRTVLVGWGKHGRLWDRDVEVAELLKEVGSELVCLALNKDGTPVHPLYQKKDLWPTPFDGKKRWLEAGMRKGELEIKESFTTPDPAVVDVLHRRFGEKDRAPTLHDWPGDGMPPPGPDPDDDPIMEVARARTIEDPPVPPGAAAEAAGEGPGRRAAPQASGVGCSCDEIGSEGSLAGAPAARGPRLPVAAPGPGPEDVSEGPPTLYSFWYIERNVSKSQRRVTRWDRCKVVQVSSPPHVIVAGVSERDHARLVGSWPGTVRKQPPPSAEPEKEAKPRKASKKKRAALAGETLYERAERLSVESDRAPRKVGKYDFEGGGDGG